jgi:hypothetical protein
VSEGRQTVILCSLCGVVSISLQRKVRRENASMCLSDDGLSSHSAVHSSWQRWLLSTCVTLRQAEMLMSNLNLQTARRLRTTLLRDAPSAGPGCRVTTHLSTPARCLATYLACHLPWSLSVARTGWGNVGSCSRVGVLPVACWTAPRFSSGPRVARRGLLPEEATDQFFSREGRTRVTRHRAVVGWGVRRHHRAPRGVQRYGYCCSIPQSDILGCQRGKAGETGFGMRSAIEPRSKAIDIHGRSGRQMLEVCFRQSHIPTLA